MRISDWSSDVCSSDLYAKTFKSGGINQNGVPNGADGNPILAAATVKPESVDHYEAGVKTEFWDRRVTLNLSAFRTDIRHFQANVHKIGSAHVSTHVTNAHLVCRLRLEKNKQHTRNT